MNEQANRWAHVLVVQGVLRGDVVGIVMDNRPEYVFALLGLSKIRAVAACVNTHLTGRALRHALAITKPRLILAGSEHEASIDEIRDELGALRPAPAICVHDDRGGSSRRGAINSLLERMAKDRPGALRPRGSEAMAYLYTSGTTGLPKAAVVTNQRFLLAAYSVGKVLHEATPDDVIYVALPLYHGAGQWCGLGACLATRAALALRRKFSASSFWTDAVRFGATRLVYVGELCRYLSQQPPSPDERRHRVAIAVGNGLRPDVWLPFQRRFGIPTIREFYGATEGNAPLANLEGRPGMLGRMGRGQALIECDLTTGISRRDPRGRCRRIERVGETGLFIGRISRTARFDGYVDERATDAKILRDVFRLHEDGWVSFADRVGDTFRWKGENVSTSEVSELLNAAPGVLESNVYGVVVPRAEGRAGMASLKVTPEFDVDAFARHVHERLPSYARPLFLRLQQDMRTTSTLKHQKGGYQSEGYDPDKVADPLLVLLGSRYEPMSREQFAKIQSGELSPG